VAADDVTRLRRTALVLLATGIAVATTGGALASPQFSATFQLTYLSQQPDAPSGQVPLFTWTDPGAPAEVPKAIKRIVLTFHPGTRFDTSALARCRASDTEIKAKGASACPAASELGTGHTTGVFGSGAEFVTDVTLYNARDEIIVLVFLNGTLVTEFRDRVKDRKITIEPVLPDGVSLKRLKLRIGPHSKGSGARQRTYMRNPSSCPARGKWTTVAKLTYSDGSGRTLRSASPCRHR
jgi:hypothetical protein